MKTLTTVGGAQWKTMWNYENSLDKKRIGEGLGFSFFTTFVNKKTVKKRSFWPLGLTPPSPLPRSGQVNVKNSRQVAIFGVILPFYIGQKWVKIFTNRSGQAGGGVTPLG